MHSLTRSEALPDLLFRRERGSVLLLTLLVVTALVYLVASVMPEIRTRVDVSRLDKSAFRAEIAASSGLDYILANLGLNTDWEPSLPAPQILSLGPDTNFSIEQTFKFTDMSGTDIRYLIEGIHEDGHVLLEASVHVDPDPLVTKALVTLGTTNVFTDTIIRGEMAIADKLGVVYDYVADPADPEGGNWVPGGKPTLGAISFTNSSIDVLQKYKPIQYLPPPTVEVQRTAPLYAPAWNLDEYLVPGPGKVLVDHRGGGDLWIEDQAYEETVVVLLDPGNQLVLRNSDLRGGLVLYAEPTYNPRSGPRNSLLIKHPPCFVGTGSNGAYEHLGILAPGAEFTIHCSHLQTLIGLFLFHSALDADKFYMEGQAIFLDDINNMVADITFNPAITANLPGGFRYGGARQRLKLNYMREFFRSP